MTADELHAIRAELDWLDAHASGLIGSGIHCVGSGTHWATQHLRAFLDGPKFQPSRKARVTDPFPESREVFERR